MVGVDVAADAEEYVAFLSALTHSSDPTVAEQASTALTRFVGKFNPLEPRAVTGQWTTGGGGDTQTVTVGVNPTPQSRQAARTQATHAREQATQARQAAHQQATDAKAAAKLQISQASTRIAEARSKAGKTNTAAAVAATRTQLSIPSGKQFKQLPLGQQQAANQIVAATRQLATIHGQQAQADAELGAINQALKDSQLQPATVAWLKGQQAKATARQAALAGQAKTAQRQLAAGWKAWRRR